MSGHTISSERRSSASRHLPRFIDHTELQGRWAYKRLFKSAELEDAASGHDPERTAAQFKRMHFCARRMNKLLQRHGKGAEARPDYKGFAVSYQQLRDQIAAENVGLVYSLYRQNRIAYIDGDELLSEGMMALTRAIDTFDPWRGFRFSTYACYAIIRAFYRAGVQRAKRRQCEPVNFDVALERGQWTELQRAEQSVLYRERLADILASESASLTQMESEVLALRFPMSAGATGQTLAEVGERMSLSKERVRQIQNAALAKLRRTLEADPVLTGAVA